MTPNEDIDQTGIPTHECFNCGSGLFRIVASFENYEVSMYITDGVCAMCESPITVPTLEDHPFWNKKTKKIEMPDA